MSRDCTAKTRRELAAAAQELNLPEDVRLLSFGMSLRGSKFPRIRIAAELSWDRARRIFEGMGKPGSEA